MDGGVRSRRYLGITECFAASNAFMTSLLSMSLPLPSLTLLPCTLGRAANPSTTRTSCLFSNDFKRVPCHSCSKSALRTTREANSKANGPPRQQTGASQGGISAVMRRLLKFIVLRDTFVPLLLTASQRVAGRLPRESCQACLGCGGNIDNCFGHCSHPTPSTKGPKDLMFAPLPQ